MGMTFQVRLSFGVAQAQLVGWLEGLFHGIQAALFAQQVAAKQQFEQMRQLPSNGAGPAERNGTYPVNVHGKMLRALWYSRQITDL